MGTKILKLPFCVGKSSVRQAKSRSTSCRTMRCQSSLSNQAAELVHALLFIVVWSPWVNLTVNRKAGFIGRFIGLLLSDRSLVRFFRIVAIVGTRPRSGNSSQ